MVLQLVTYTGLLLLLGGAFDVLATATPWKERIGGTPECDLETTQPFMFVRHYGCGAGNNDSVYATAALEPRTGSVAWCSAFEHSINHPLAATPFYGRHSGCVYDFSAGNKDPTQVIVRCLNATTGALIFGFSLAMVSPQTINVTGEYHQFLAIREVSARRAYIATETAWYSFDPHFDSLSNGVPPAGWVLPCLSVPFGCLNTFFFEKEVVRNRPNYIAVGGNDSACGCCVFGWNATDGAGTSNLSRDYHPLWRTDFPAFNAFCGGSISGVQVGEWSLHPPVVGTQSI